MQPVQVCNAIAKKRKRSIKAAAATAATAGGAATAAAATITAAAATAAAITAAATAAAAGGASRKKMQFYATFKTEKWHRGCKKKGGKNPTSVFSLHTGILELKYATKTVRSNQLRKF